MSQQTDAEWAAKRHARLAPRYVWRAVMPVSYSGGQTVQLRVLARAVIGVQEFQADRTLLLLANGAGALTVMGTFAEWADRLDTAGTP